MMIGLVLSTPPIGQGSVLLPTLAPHVAVADLDNDGWLDIVTTASARTDGTSRLPQRRTRRPFLRRFAWPRLRPVLDRGPVADIDHDG